MTKTWYSTDLIKDWEKSGSATLTKPKNRARRFMRTGSGRFGVVVVVVSLSFA